MKVTRNIQIGIITLLCSVCVTFWNHAAEAQVLTIGSGSAFIVNGGTLDVNCLDIAVLGGGSLLLQSGSIKDKGEITVAASGIYNNSGGTVINCFGGSQKIIIIPLPNTGLVIPVAIPQ